jgi:hypothetical protein
MGERIGQIGRIDNGFFGRVCLESAKNKKNPLSIRPIRSSIVSLFSKTETAGTEMNAR